MCAMGCNVSAAASPRRQNSQKNSFKKNSVKPEADKIKAEMNGNAEFDPRLPLTVRQRFNIMKSWKGIARNIEKTGILMFLRLFESNDAIKTMFGQILKGNENLSDMLENKTLENHVTMVMYTLDEAISSLEDVDFVVNMLHSVGQSHRRFTNFNPAIFWKIEEPFLVAVKDTLGDRYTANMELIYKKTIKFILETLTEGFKVD